MMRSILFFTLLSFATFTFGQTQSGIVIDNNGRPMPNVSIRDTLTTIVVQTNGYGAYTINKQPASYYEVSYYGFETRFLSIAELKDTIVLNEDARLLDGVTINSSRINSILTTENISIVDYYPRAQDILILYRHGNEKNLMSRGYDGVNHIYKLDSLNPRSIEVDCFGNIQLLTSKEAIQIWIDVNDKLSIVDRHPLEEYTEILSPCEAIFDGVYIKSMYSSHRQRYTLSIKKSGEQDFTPFFESFDKDRTIAAQALYNEIIVMYFAVTDETSNIIINEMWSGKMIELAFTDTLVMMIGFYEKNIARKTFLETFQHENQLVTFDVNFDTLYTFNTVGETIHQTPLLNNRKNKPTEIIQDTKRLDYYAIHFEDAIYSISSIDTKTGEFTELTRITEAPFAENIQIYDGKVYFLSANHGFRKLYSIVL